MTQEGKEHIVAPYTGQTKPGMKRVIYAVTDTVWTTYHPTDENNPEKIAEQILETEQ